MKYKIKRAGDDTPWQGNNILDLKQRLWHIVFSHNWHMNRQHCSCGLRYSDRTAVDRPIIRHSFDSPYFKKGDAI